jgi:hypothetical protein
MAGMMNLREDEPLKCGRLPPLIVARAEGQTYDGSRGEGTGSTVARNRVVVQVTSLRPGDTFARFAVNSLKLLTAKAAKEFREVREEQRALRNCNPPRDTKCSFTVKSNAVEE